MNEDQGEQRKGWPSAEKNDENERVCENTCQAGRGAWHIVVWVLAASARTPPSFKLLARHARAAYGTREPTSRKPLPNHEHP